MPLSAVGKTMTWSEATRQTKLLVRDTSSQVGAALAGWQYPATREALVAMDHYDAFMRATFKKPRPYPRPWDQPAKRFGTASLSIDELTSILNHHRGMTSHRRDARGRLRDHRGRFVRDEGRVESG